MSKFSVRKLFLFGRYSIALLLPRNWARELELDNRSFVALEFDRTKKRIIVSPAPDGKINNGDLRPTEKLSGKTSSLIKEPGPRKNEQKNRPDDQEWEPIPQL